MLLRGLWGRCVGGVEFGGWALHPLPDQVTRAPTLEIVRAIRCEARAAILQHAPGWAFNGGAIGFVFKFDITEHNHAGLDLEFKKQFPSGTFDLNFSGITSASPE